MENSDFESALLKCSCLGHFNAVEPECTTNCDYALNLCPSYFDEVLAPALAVQRVLAERSSMDAAHKLSEMRLKADIQTPDGELSIWQLIEFVEAPVALETPIPTFHTTLLP
jgi:hypothetical protein